MELIIILVAILQSVSVSLGVGCSTIAIINFFTAIADGKIDETERKMMGVVYTVLRVAMVLILFTTTILTAIFYGEYGFSYFTPYVIGYWMLIVVLFANAVLMTKHVMPSTVGPALQAATWYTLGILMSLLMLGLFEFKLLHFTLGYVVAILAAVSVVNGIMSLLKRNT